MWTETLILTANLAVADIIMALFVIPFHFQAALLQRWDLPEFRCPICPFVQVSSNTLFEPFADLSWLARWEIARAFAFYEGFKRHTECFNSLCYCCSPIPWNYESSKRTHFQRLCVLFHSTNMGRINPNRSSNWS